MRVEVMRPGVEVTRQTPSATTGFDRRNAGNSQVNLFQGAARPCDPSPACPLPPWPAPPPLGPRLARPAAARSIFISTNPHHPSFSLSSTPPLSILLSSQSLSTLRICAADQRHTDPAHPHRNPLLASGLNQVKGSHNGESAVQDLPTGWFPFIGFFLLLLLNLTDNVQVK